MLHCICAGDRGTSAGRPVPVSVSSTERYMVALSVALHRSCKKGASGCVSSNVHM